MINRAVFMYTDCGQHTFIKCPDLPSAPYRVIKDGEVNLQIMIDVRRQAGLYYVIDVRAGPGRKDVSEDHRNTI